MGKTIFDVNCDNNAVTMADRTEWSQELKELLDRQQQWIKNFLDRIKNVKKAPTEPLTQEKLSEKLSELRGLWTRITEANKQILRTADMPPEYHRAFNEAKSGYLEVRKWIAFHVPDLWITDPLDNIHEEVVDSTEEGENTQKPTEAAAGVIGNPTFAPPPPNLGTRKKTDQYKEKTTSKDADTQPDPDNDEEDEEEDEIGAKGGRTPTEVSIILNARAELDPTLRAIQYVQPERPKDNEKSYAENPLLLRPCGTTAA